MKKIHLLAKIFKEKKYLNDFINGKLYMNSISYFKNYELENDKVRYDGNESLTGYWQPEFSSLELNRNKFNMNDFNGVIKLNYRKNNNKNVFCMWSISSEDNLIKNGIHIDKRNKEFGGYLAVIKNPRLFVNRVISAAEKKELNIKIGLVNYYDNNDNKTFEDNEIGFNKLIDFSYQQEYRILIDRNEENKPFSLEIGDLSDILMILSIDEFNKNIKFEKKLAIFDDLELHL